ncbi:hypothetical protein P4G95_09050 [Burkholderia vietnamiensis]|uniref:hypothetical protein n=1 Tax=Burkholderia vietnamiensis TaxID=60552 RepID=UPI001593AA5F|nr:hypothetical protein [Burkholderia vietnamiensis]WHU91025.1 hypothetical protein P4G95_09050 [Burkholderia vietnamiensis]
MNQMTEPSTFKRPDWPLDALPQHWVEALFSKMAAFYGSRFASMWNGVNVVEVQRAWAIELGKLSRDQLKAGSDNLTALPKPPTLPEFVALCRQARSEQAASTTPRLADERPADRATVEANLGAIRRVQERVMRREPTAEWAFKLLMRGKSASGAALPSEVVRCARDAIVSSAGFKIIIGKACENSELLREYQTIRDAALGALTNEGVA